MDCADCGYFQYKEEDDEYECVLDTCPYVHATQGLGSEDKPSEGQTGVQDSSVDLKNSK